MVKGPIQVFGDTESLLAKLEAIVRNNTPWADLKNRVHDFLDEYEKLPPDQQGEILSMTIQMALAREDCKEAPSAWTVLDTLCARILGRDDVPPKQLAQLAMMVQLGHIKPKRLSGRPPRGQIADMAIILAHRIYTENLDYRPGKAQEKIAGWLPEKPRPKSANAVAQIISSARRRAKEQGI